MERLPCQCCAYLTVLLDPETQAPLPSLCEVCGWRHIPWEWACRPKAEAQILTARRCFDAHRACEPGCGGCVREPREDEIPQGGWLSHDQRRKRDCQNAIDLIAAAFASVALGKGIRLHDACVLDDYWGFQPPADYLAALPKDTASHWANTSVALLNRYPEFFSYANAEGWRYYLPAYMTAALRQLQGPVDQSMDMEDELGRSLDRPEGKDALLNQAQREAVREYQRVVALHSL